MLYRKFGKTNEDVSVLGFGCMRLPVINNNPVNIDEDKAIKMIRYAIDHGVNYVDTAYPYHGTGFGKAGESEPLLAKALKDGYRERVNIATKLPSWMIESREDMDRLLNEQLKRLETDTIDFYLVHTLNKKLWPKLKKFGISDFLDKAISDGKIRYAGFSFHDDCHTFKEIVDEYDWSFCQIQYNYLDKNYQAGKEGLMYAAKKGLGVAIMEPLKGGNIVNNIPKSITDIWNEADVKRTSTEWAFRWLYNHPEISVVLSGMTEIEHVVENVKIANDAKENSLTQEELKLVDRVAEVFKKGLKINCTTCGYCMPCPTGINIPESFALYNNAYLSNNITTDKNRYHARLSEKQKASNCIECGKCESQCPQGISIIKELKNVVDLFEKK